MRHRRKSLGGVGVVFSGDFAQLPPIGQRSLIHKPRPWENDGCEKSPIASRLFRSGIRRFGEVTSRVRLRVVYRQGGPCPFKESAMRLRDGAMTLEDYKLWQSHDIPDPENCDPCALERADKYLWLCAENADAGRRNGDKVGNLAETQGFPIIRYESTHGNIAAEKLRPGEFKRLRTVTHLAKEALVILTCNKMRGVETALLGLTNGDRCEVTGPRHSSGPVHPGLPTYLDGNFATYTGDPIFPGVGREKWAHVPIIEAFGKTRKNLDRSGAPLILRWEISIAKSHGLTWGDAPL